jgi:hypothetical protein
MFFNNTQPNVFQPPPQNRHPERSASQICRITERLIGAESKDPGDADLSMLFGVFQPPSPHLDLEG